VQYRTFGRTGWRVSEIAFGGWQLGGDWGPVDDRPVMRGRYPAWHLRAAVDASLRRLGVERIDLFQLHGWLASGTEELDWLETLNALRTEGKVDQIGVSIRDYRPEEGVALAQLGLSASIQVVFNMFEQRPAATLFPAGAATRTAFIARVPFDSGALIGNWTEDTYAWWSPGSVPHTLFRGERFAETLRRVNRLKQLCAPYYPTLAEAAIRYSLRPGEVATVIPGMRNPAEVDMNVVHSDGAQFPGELAEQLTEHGWPRNFYK
jgi:aryl-alcohol dehydrogenase-like predicted oxidoreductase